MDYRSAIISTANSLGVPPALALAVAQRESGIQQYAADGSVLRRVEPDGRTSYGIFQLLSGTAADMGVNPMDPAQNILGGVKYLKTVYGWTGDWRKALEAYNGGIRNVREGTVSEGAQRYAVAVLSAAGMPLTGSPGVYQPSGSTPSYPGATALPTGIPAPDLSWSNPFTIQQPDDDLLANVFSDWDLSGGPGGQGGNNDAALLLALGLLGVGFLIALV